METVLCRIISIEWRKVYRNVSRLQVRIVKAFQEGKIRKAGLLPQYTNYCLQMEKSGRIFHNTLHNMRTGGKYCEIFPCFFCGTMAES
ncbi:MAG: hypothetical protein GY749_13310 [Desulfobacteraceae bacterium]|nr:hypothetical protein [Desulfobacteraceae bacterium]